MSQVVLLLGLEVQRGHVVEHEADVAVSHGVGEAGRRDLVAVATLLGAGQRAAHRALVRGILTQIDQHAAGVEDRGRLHDPGDHEVAEGLVVDDVESEIVVDPHQGVEEQL